MINVYISKADKILPVDWDNMPEAAKAHIIEYGLRQKLNDAGSSAIKKDLGAEEAGNQAFAMAEVVLSALMEGKTKTRTARAGITLEEREFNKILKANYKKVFGETLEDMDGALEALADKLGVKPEILEAKIQEKATAQAEITRQIQAIKESSSIELTL